MEDSLKDRLELMPPMDMPVSLAELHQQCSAPSPGVLETLRNLDGDVLVLGAGGKMGLHLCAMLQRAFRQLGKSNQVQAVSRFGQADIRSAFHGFGVRTVACDLTCDQQLLQLPDCPTVFFLAGFKFGATEAVDKLREMNEVLPARVARRWPNSRFVALSTGCVYSFVTPQSGGARETDATSPVGAYAQSCLGREVAFQQSNVTCCLVRLNYSVDLRYGVLVDIAQAILEDRPVDLRMGYANVIWQGDAVTYIIQALTLAERPASILNVTGPRILSIRETAEHLGRLLNKTVRTTGAESSTAWLNNADRCLELFGPPRVNEDTLMSWVATWLSSGGSTLGKPTHFEVRDGTF